MTHFTKIVEQLREIESTREKHGHAIATVYSDGSVGFEYIHGDVQYNGLKRDERYYNEDCGDWDRPRYMDEIL